MGRLRSVLLAGTACLGAAAARAEVVTDGSLGPRVSLSGAEVEVGAGLGATRGRNLFHSFERFGVPAGSRVTFTGPDGLDNVISRVTGGERSRIDGTLRSTVPNADFYLINPSGVVFGPDSVVDVPAAFHVSTADRLRFSDGAQLETGAPSESGLSVARPEAFGFLGAPPAAIEVNDTALGVLPGQTLDLVGGDIRLAGGILFVDEGLTPAIGTLRLAAQRGAGEVPVGVAGDAVARDGAITLAPGDLLNASGVGLGSNGGTRVRLEGGEVLLVGSLLGDMNSGATDSGGTVEVAARALLVRASGPDQPGGILVTPMSTGRGSDVRVTAELVDLAASGIFSVPLGAGGAGDITIDAGRILLDGAIVGSPGLPDAVGGASGLTTVRARDDITLRNAAQINSSALGGADAGDVVVLAGGRILVDNSLIASESQGPGNAGLVAIGAGALELVNEGRIRSVAGAAGDAGDIRIVADRLLIDSTPLDHAPAFNTGINAGADVGSTGAAGSISIMARDIRLLGRGAGEAEIAASTRGAGLGGNIGIAGAERLVVDSSFVGSGTASPFATARGGTVEVEAREIELRGGGRIFNGTSPVLDPDGNPVAFGLGDGGDIEVRAERILIDGRLERPVPFATAIGADANPLTFGRAGNIRVETGELTILNDGQIASNTLGGGAGGDVRVVVAGHLRIENGLIGASTTSPFDTADAGTVRITAGSIELRDQGRVFNGTSPVLDGNGNLLFPGAGDGGDVIVEVAGRLLIDGRESQPRPFLTGISASANPGTTGAAGDVRVTAGRIDVVNGGDISSGSAGTAPGGDVTVAAKAIGLRDRGQIVAAGRGLGDAGTISIATGDTLAIEGGLVTTDSTAAGGGRIVIRSGRLVYLDGGAIVSSVQGDATTTAGDITVTAPQVALGDGSRIVAQANAGRGGNIQIDAGTLVASVASVIDASAQTGISGTVVTTSPEVDLTSGLVVLPTVFLNVDNLLQESCAARGTESLSSFTATGRGGLPPSPEQPLAAGYTGAGDGGGATARGCGG